ncbi:MAG: DNA primase DnaG [archaeon]
MGKVSPVSIKYVIHADFNAIGTVEKPDVIGALFGQTEGLLGQELELRELQKQGKIGRIDVNLDLDTVNGKTTGKIQVPSALDKIETTLVAAAIETIERIGPSDAKITIERVEDVRSNKREYIIDRAKKLLEQINSSSPETQEIHEAVTISSRMSKLQEYGEEKLPAGDLTGEGVIVVEGRADVLNLLKHGVSNVVGMNGTNMPAGIQELGKEKELTLFVDGDRGGVLIAKNVIKNADVDFVVFASDGKEVEELSGKEIISALRRKITVSEFKDKFDKNEESPRRTREYSSHSSRGGERSYGGGYRGNYRRDEGRVEETKTVEKASATPEEMKKFQEIFTDMVGTKGAAFLDSSLKLIEKVPAGEIISALNSFKGNVYALIVDGIATLSIVRTAERFGCRHIIAKNFASCETSINLVSL